MDLPGARILQIKKPVRRDPAAELRAYVPPVAAAPAPKKLVPKARHRLLRAALLILVAALVLRAVFLEPFTVTSGSMALSLRGQRREVDCPRCGTKVIVGAPTEGVPPKHHFGAAICPHCGCDRLYMDLTPDIHGDRLLVEKITYALRAPKRWDVAVFHTPVGDRPFVKRVAGLPNESIQILDGDVYVNGTVVRKPIDVCRSVSIPVVDLKHALPEVDNPRWLSDGPQLAVKDRELILNCTAAPAQFQWMTYVHRTIGSLAEIPIEDDLPYNNAGLRPEAVHDFRVTAQLQVVSGSGEVAIALSDGKDAALAILPVAGSEGVRLDCGTGLVQSANDLKLISSKWHRVELAFIDRQAWLAVDGKQAVPIIELPPIAGRPPVSRPLRFGAKGVDVIIRDVVLSRDVHYRSAGRNGNSEPCKLGADEFFMLGDNSANSDDSRHWPIPGVRRADIFGRPLLMHLPSRARETEWFGQRSTSQAIDWSRIGGIR